MSAKCHGTVTEPCEARNAMTKKFWKRLLIGVGSTFLLLVAVLFVHIWMVTRPKPGDDQRVRQLARIDFQQELTPKVRAELVKDFKAMEGTRTFRFNPDEKAMVYEIDPEIQSTEAVYQNLVVSNDFKAKKYAVPVAMKSGGCPAIDKNSFTYRLGKMFEGMVK